MDKSISFLVLSTKTKWNHRTCIDISAFSYEYLLETKHNHTWTQWTRASAFLFFLPKENEITEHALIFQHLATNISSRQNIITHGRNGQEHQLSCSFYQKEKKLHETVPKNRGKVLDKHFRHISLNHVVYLALREAKCNLRRYFRSPPCLTSCKIS